MLPKRNSQIEAVCADGLGRVLLLQETPPRVELIDPKALKVVASIDLAVEGRSEIAQAWSDPKGSRGEGAVLLPGGRLFVAKEEKPAAFIEFGPPHSRSRGLVRGGALADGERWPIKKGHHRFVALAIWLPDKTLAKTCADFSDLEIGPDGYLYLLSDKSSTIARLDDLPAGGGTAALLDARRLGDLDSKPEGLAFTAQGRAIVGLRRAQAAPKSRPARPCGCSVARSWLDSLSRSTNRVLLVVEDVACLAGKVCGFYLYFIISVTRA